MTPNPRIHQPSAKTFSTGRSSTPTITESAALWKALKRREEVERRNAQLKEELAAGGLFLRLRYAIAGVFGFGARD